MFINFCPSQQRRVVDDSEEIMSGHRTVLDHFLLCSVQVKDKFLLQFYQKEVGQKNGKVDQ